MTAALALTPIFGIPLWADLLAVGIGSLQGALFAAQFRDRRLDLLGVAIIGIATGFGGGIMRDVLLGEVPAALVSNWYLPVATGSALVGMLLERIFHRLRHLITVLDALTIGLFGAIGTTKALSLGLPEIPAIFVGVISAVGGSILRDLLLNVPIALMSVGLALRRRRARRHDESRGSGRVRRRHHARRDRLRRVDLRRARARRALQVDAARAGRAEAPQGAPDRPGDGNRSRARGRTDG